MPQVNIRTSALKAASKGVDIFSASTIIPMTYMFLNIYIVYN